MIITFDAHIPALSKMTLHPQLGKMLLYGVLMHCVNPILAIVSVLDDKDPFSLVFDIDNSANNNDVGMQVRRRYAQTIRSDHWMTVNLKKAFNNRRLSHIHRPLHFMEAAEESFCNDNVLNLVIMRDQYRKVGELKRFLESQNFVRRRGWDLFNENSGNTMVVLGVVAAGLYPNVMTPFTGTGLCSCHDNVNSNIFFSGSENAFKTIKRRVFKAGMSQLKTEQVGGEDRQISQRSVNFPSNRNSNQIGLDEFVVYFNARQWQDGPCHVHECSVVDPISARVFTPLGERVRASGSLATDHMDNLRRALFDMLERKSKSEFPGRQDLIKFLRNPETTM